MALYVYGLMRAGDVPDHVDAEPGAHAVCAGEIGALVGEVETGAVRVRRQSVLAHSEILREALEHGPVLPLRFGTVLADEAALEEELIAPRAGWIISKLDALEDKAELHVKAMYREAPLLHSILAANAPLRNALQRMRGMPAAATHFERIRIGEAIAAAVETQRERESAALLAVLTPHATAVTALSIQHERMALHAAFLVAREDEGAFDAAVEALSREHAERLDFTLIGPLPAYSFVDHEWDAAWA